MTRRIFASALLAAALVLVSTLALVTGMLYAWIAGTRSGNLQESLTIAAVGTEMGGEAFLASLDLPDRRITWIAPDGSVLYDSHAERASMDNHADREEFLEARATGHGSSSRLSGTLTEETLYEAVALPDGSVLRIATRQPTVAGFLGDIFLPILFIAAVAAALSAAVSHKAAREIVKPINNLDLEHPLSNDVYEEISPLLQRINRQHIQLDVQMRALRQKTDEFSQITGNMQEGLVLLDIDGRILFMNPTAQSLFEASDDSMGKDILRLEQSAEMRDAVNSALDHGRGAIRLTRRDRDWQLDLSRIESQGRPVGAAILAFDITDTVRAEANRREFSANVSHELKTPLQSIMGSAELLESGMVKAEDMPRFLGHIRRESGRLLDLIQDIIRLSQLDEGVSLPMEEVDLLDMAREVTDELRDAAAGKNVSLSVLGHSCPVRGVRRLLHEIVYNLCDNAIKYNIPGGSVCIRTESGSITVSDTGIGIPAAHQSRIFERFYRVDKSHSKSSGGTGLGLSIVKHAAQYHNAVLELTSEPGRGTSITVRF